MVGWVGFFLVGCWVVGFLVVGWGFFVYYSILFVCSNYILEFLLPSCVFKLLPSRSHGTFLGFNFSGFIEEGIPT